MGLSRDLTRHPTQLTSDHDDVFTVAAPSLGATSHGRDCSYTIQSDW